MGIWSSLVAIAGVVAAPFTGGASLALTAAALVAPKVVDKVVDFVMKPFLGMMGMPSLDMSAAQEAERQQGVLIQRKGSVVNIPVVYGYRKVGDIVTFAETGSTDNKYLWVAHVFSEGTVAALNKMFIDDNELPAEVVSGLNAGNIVDVASGKYSGRVRLQFFKGVYWTDPTPINHPVRSTCFFNTDSVKPPNWSSDMVYNGLAVVFARYEWKKVTTQADADSNPFGYNIPSLSVEMFGKLLSPVPASAPANEYDNDTARYETITTGTGQTIGYTNPVEVLLDYLRNPRYGKGLKNSDIDWASWNIAAQKCKTEVTYATGIKGPIMSMNYVLDTSSTLFNNTKNLLSNFRGYMPYIQGKYKLKIEDAGHPTDILSGAADIVATFTKDNIIGDITYTGIERTSKYNQVVVTWVDPDNKWSNQEVVYPETEAERQIYINEDSGRENKGAFTASGITNAIMAKDIARILFWKSRLSDSISLTVSSQGLDLEPGDCIHISANLLTFTNVFPWRIISTSINNDMTVTLGCVFVPDTIFPYARWNEPDRLLPVYIPKGAERYYPVIVASEKNGLLPPYPGKPWSGGNNQVAANDVIQITKISFVSLGTTAVGSSDNIYADLTFNQPVNSMYSSTKFYWKEDVASAKTWAEFESFRNPGPGQEIIVRVGPVIYGKTYALNSRVQYQSGQASSQLGAYTFLVGTAAVTPTPPAGTPTTTPTPLPNPADNFFSSVTATTVLDGSNHPKNPRQIQFTVKQDMTAGNNSYLNALEIFWKPSLNAKWNYTKGTMTAIQGSDVTFTIDCGVPQYPLRPGYNNEAPANVDDYDFIFRWAYNDGKSSIYQYRAMNVSTEWNGITWGPFNPLALTGTGTVINNKELSANYIPLIATAADIVDTRNIAIGTPYFIKDNKASPALPAIWIYFQPPVATDRANWAGVRVYRHKAGASGTGDYVDFRPASVTSLSNEFYVTLYGITYDETWEYVLVPLVVYGDTVVEANKGQYISGKIHNRSSDADYPATENWVPKFRVDNQETLSLALAKRGTAVATPPRQDTYLDTYGSSTVTTGGYPSTPRQISFTLKQSTANGTNGHITGYVVYYKQSDAVYWKRSVYPLTSYTEGSTVTFNSMATTPSMDLGYPSYPSFPGRDQYYDFVIRYRYDNGSESTYESFFNNCRIENSGTGSSPTTAIYDFSPLGPNGFASHRVTTQLITEDQAPPGAVLDVRDILTSTSMNIIELAVMDPPTAGNNLRFAFSIPIASLKSYLAGFRILRRDVVEGTNTVFTVDDTNMPFKSGEAYINNVYTPAITAWSKDTVWHKEYEWAVIPMVWYQGVKTEANNSIYWRGKVCDSYNSIANDPWTANYLSKRPAEIIPTASIRNKLQTPFTVSNPCAAVTSITRIGATTATGGEAAGYHSIQVQLPSNFVSMTIYRRQAHDYNDATNGGWYAGKYSFTDAGRWEKIDISNTTYPNTTGPNGTFLKTINLRPALADAFNDNSQYGYNVTRPKSLVKNFDNTLYLGYFVNEPGTDPTGVNSKPKYWLLGDGYHGSYSGGKITQLFIVITTSNGLSNRGTRVDLYNYRKVNGVTTYNPPANLVTDVSYVNTADMEAAMDISKLDVSYASPAVIDPSWTTLYRKMSEALNLVADSNIVSPTTLTWTTSYTKPTATPPVI